MQKISPFLWFDHQAEEAANFYVSIFKNSKLGKISRYGENMPQPKGSVMVVEFTLDGQTFNALNGGPMFHFNESVSFAISVETQEEVDHYWEKLTAGGTPSQCGWLKDKFGLSWQVVPTAIPRLINDPDAARRNRVMQAIMQMTKPDIPALERAAAGKD